MNAELRASQRYSRYHQVRVKRQPDSTHSLSLKKKREKKKSPTLFL
jgi:hypothetical protein